MIFHSIKWRLQAWHALLMIVVLAGFGFTAYQLDRVNRFQRVDRELQQRADVVIRALRQGGPPGSDNRRPPPGELREEFPPLDRFDDRPPRRDGPPRNDSGPSSGPELSAQDLSWFTTNSVNAYYYALFHRSGQLLSKSTATPADLTIPARNSANNIVRVRGKLREIIIFTPPGEAVVAGLDISSEQAELRRLGWLLCGAGSGVLLLGLVGGWWMATRAIRPIQDIGSTATKISAGDLSQRIPAADAENELGQLAVVLNSTFARLETAFAQQQQFTSDAAHELRTPVSVILTQVQSTLNKERSGAEYRETLEACQRAAQRMKRLIESLLELARFDAGQEQLKRGPFDLAEKTRECIELLQPLAVERRVKISADLAIASCAGDSERLSQVITNLLTNAVTYNRPDGEVRVAVGPQAGSVILTVTDTGLGIAPEDAPHVFKRFYRADKSRAAGTATAVSASPSVRLSSPPTVARWISPANSIGARLLR
ncbi:MAG: histidine kinase dimerization/phospho-acceptor domain-containing protein [Verrucomicrobiota bacterium]